MKKYITNEKIGMDYTLVGEIYLPNIISIKTKYEIGIWGNRHKNYLKEFHKSFYYSLLAEGNLNSYLHEIDVKATEMYDRLVKQLAEKQGVTEELKVSNQMLWVQKMNNICNQAREIVNAEIIYVSPFKKAQ